MVTREEKKELLRKVICEIEDPEKKHILLRFCFKDYLPAKAELFVPYFIKKHDLTNKCRKVRFAMRRKALLGFLDMEFGFVPRSKFKRLFNLKSHTTIFHAIEKSRVYYYHDDDVYMRFYNEVKKEYEEFKPEIQESK